MTDTRSMAFDKPTRITDKTRIIAVQALRAYLRTQVLSGRERMKAHNAIEELEGVAPGVDGGDPACPCERRQHPEA